MSTKAKIRGGDATARVASSALFYVQQKSAQLSWVDLDVFKTEEAAVDAMEAFRSKITNDLRVVKVVA